jgi:putative endonuclease
MKTYYVYIMSSQTGILYVGVTNNLELRVHQHKSKTIEGFTKRYNITCLVYYTAFEDVIAAIAAEKRIKGWVRARKVALVEETNPDWRDLSADWYEG